jgi:flavin-dependent dehydrogenase
MQRGDFDADVGIVGGGPAGARAAERLAARGVDVVLWDPKAPWEKPCGGGLTAALISAVPELHDVLPRARLIDRIIAATNRSPSVELPLRRPIHVIARRELGAWQLDRARAAGVDVVADAVRGVARLDAASHSGWAITLRSGQTRRVRTLIGADGAASFVRAAIAPTLRVALEPTRITYPPAESTGRPEMITLRFSQGLHGYAWDFPRLGHHSVGAVVGPGGGTRATLDAEIDAIRTPTPVERQGAVIGSALYPLRRSGYHAIGGADFALVGDAAGFADPATGEGITNAFVSGELAADTFVRDRSFARYPRLAAARFEREFRAARWLRRLLYDREYAVRLLGAAIHGARFRAAAIVLVNDTNEHRSLAGMVVRTVMALAFPASFEPGSYTATPSPV